MKGQKNSSHWEFHGFSSNPEKSYTSGKKGSVLATQASLKQIANPTSEAKDTTTSNASTQGKSAKGKSWQNPSSSAKDTKTKKTSSKE